MSDDDTLDILEAEADMLRQYLTLREVPCPSCGYNLRSLTGGRCPECGSELELRVGLTRPISMMWVVSLVSAGMGFAGAGVFFALALVAAPPGWIWETTSGWLMAVLTPACGLLLAGLMVMRRRFGRWPKGRQRIIAILITLVVLITLTLIVMLFEN